MTLSLRALRTALAPLRQAVPRETVTFEMGGASFSFVLTLPTADQEVWAVNFARETLEEGGESAGQDATRRYQLAVLSQVIVEVNGTPLTEEFVETEDEVSPGVRKKVPRRDAIYAELSTLPGTLLLSLFSRFNIMLQTASAEIARGIDYPKAEAEQKVLRLRSLADALESTYKTPEPEAEEEDAPKPEPTPEPEAEAEPLRSVETAPTGPLLEPVAPEAVDEPLQGPEPIPAAVGGPLPSGLNPAARPRPR